MSLLQLLVAPSSVTTTTSAYEKLRAGITWLELSMAKAQQVVEMNTVEVQNYHKIRSDIGLPSLCYIQHV